MSVELSVELDAATPVYEQLRSQIAGHITAGDLRAGERLPTVRALAADLGIAVNTVNRAFTELESAGLVTARRRVGTVVAEPRGQVGSALLRDAVDGFARAAQEAGLSDDGAVDLLRAALRRGTARG